MAATTSTPVRRSRHARRRGRVLAVYGLLLGLLGGLVAIGWVARTAEAPPTPAPPTPAPSRSVDAPSGSVAVAQTLLRSGTITFEVRNDGAHPVTIAQIAVNDAFWPFTARPRTTIAPHRTALMTLHYPWDAGVAYEVEFISSTGATFVTDVNATTTASAASSL